MFVLHGSLLAVYLLLYTSMDILAYNGFRADGNKQYVLLGLSNVCKILMNIVQLTTYFLVVHLMLPLTEQQVRKKAEFVKFLFVGFVKQDQLESAILAQNPHLTEEQQQTIHEDIERLHDFTRKRQNTQSILSSVAHVNFEDYNNVAF